MKQLLKNSLCALAAVISLASCDKSLVYYSYSHAPEGAWHKSDTLFFDVSLSDSMIPIQVSVETRYRISYPYRTLTLTATHNMPDSTVFRTDTILLSLTDSDGNRKDSNWSYLYQASGNMGVVRVPHPGNYTIKISQLSADSIMGINDIGIRMKRLKER